ncbi:MAG: carbohydrate ABC transporter permease [Ruminiclostridium sp.]
MKRAHIGTIVKYIFLILVTLVSLYPIVWVFINSFKTNDQLLLNPWGFSSDMHSENYIQAWAKANIGRYFLNSVFICTITLIITVLLSTTAAFALTRFKWKASKAVMLVFIIGMMIPIHSTLIPLFIVFSKIGIINNQLSLIIPYAAFSLPISIFILAGFMRSFPNEIEESVIIDGGSMKTLFLHFTLPLSKSSIATITIYNFVYMWNELNYAIVFLNDKNKMTLPVGLASFKGQYMTNYVCMLAAVVIATIPSLIAYMFFNNKIVTGVTSGAIKG